MINFIIRRSIQAAVTLFLITILISFSVRLIPGDPAMTLLGMQATKEKVQLVRDQLGLNKPFYKQYIEYYTDILLKGDFGNSLISGQPISKLLIQKLPVTLSLIFLALSLSVIIAIPLGTITAIKRYSAFDTIITTVTYLGISLPQFWFALMLILMFGVQLKIFPPFGYVHFSQNPFSWFWHLVLPSICLGLVYGAVLTRHVRGEMIDKLQRDYINTAAAKGLSNVRIYWHAVRNSLIPVVTILGMAIGRLLSGALIIEFVFALPGIGSGLFRAAIGRDYTVIQGFTMVIAVIFMFSLLVTDLAYSWLDPRIKYS